MHYNVVTIDYNIVVIVSMVNNRLQQNFHCNYCNKL